MAKTTVAPKPTKQARTLSYLESEFARVMRLKVAAEERRREDLADDYAAFERAEVEYKELKKHMEMVIADAPETQDIGNLNKQIEDLKLEAAGLYDPENGSTFRQADGAGFQFRATIKTFISNGMALADEILKQGIWGDIGAELTIDPKKATKMLQSHALPGLSVEPVITVAAYGPSNPKEN